MVSATELARFCSVDLKTIHNWTNAGKIPGHRTKGRHLRFKRLDVVDFLRSYEFIVPEALRGARPRVAIIDTDPHALSAMRKALTRRYDIDGFEDVVAGLVGLAAANPEVIVLGDVSPLPVEDLVARLGALASTRSARVVTLGTKVPGAAGTAPRGDPAKLREVLERITGIE
jgi:excisionase family DNA binding protein